MSKHVPPVSHNDAFRSDVLSGLGADQKRLSSKWLYDDVGSHLFEAITELDAYYPTRTELTILEEKVDKYRKLPGARGAMVELGSGSSRKTNLLLGAFPDLSVYMPIDISANHLKEAAERVRRAFPSLAVIPVAADFTEPLGQLPLLPELPVLVFFPGSTIGNFERDDAASLLKNIRTVMPNATMIVGVDRPKAQEVLIEAYDDPAGVTAAFNQNILQRINRDLNGRFDLSAFEHKAVWNAEDSRIEMHLVSKCAQSVDVGGVTFTFQEGETIHTENSHKYGEDAFAEIADEADWRILSADTDHDGYFAVYTMQAL